MNIFKQLLLVALLITGVAQTADLSPDVIEDLNSAISATSQEFDRIEEELSNEQNLTPIQLIVAQEKTKKNKEAAIKAMINRLRQNKKAVKSNPAEYAVKNAAYNAYKGTVLPSWEQTGHIPTGFRR